MRRADDCLYPTDAGLYCPLGDFFIDPVRPVPRALITHGHGDHARSGHGAVLATAQTLDIMAIRYGEDFTARRQVADGPLRLGGVEAPIPYNPDLERAAVPQVDTILAAGRKLARREV